jgi:hypothetical protein
MTTILNKLRQKKNEQEIFSSHISWIMWESFHHAIVYQQSDLYIKVNAKRKSTYQSGFEYKHLNQV